jgi:PTH1 family peptidyl-tRNA hydrolase
MKLIVGLGNPGSSYSKNRHNIGYMVVNSYLRENQFQKLDSRYGDLYKSNNSLFLKPTTFMNLSGLAVADIAKIYNIEPENILIIYDDKDITFGSISFKVKGSGKSSHNGIKNISEKLETSIFPRLKIGIGQDKSKSLIDYVLSDFSEQEFLDLEDIIKQAIKKIEEFMKEN